MAGQLARLAPVGGVGKAVETVLAATEKLDEGRLSWAAFLVITDMPFLLLRALAKWFDLEFPILLHLPPHDVKPENLMKHLLCRLLGYSVGVVTRKALNVGSLSGESPYISGSADFYAVHGPIEGAGKLLTVCGFLMILGRLAARLRHHRARHDQLAGGARGVPRAAAGCPGHSLDAQA